MSTKITDLVLTKEFTYSVEVTPDISYKHLDALSVEPAFFSITWHSKSHGCEHLEIPPMKLAKYLNSKGKTVCLHLSCDLLKTEYLNSLLHDLQNNNICNLFVILGESYDGSKSDFKSSKHLVDYIRKRTGDYFCIGVAGYPDNLDSIKELKEKVNKGANFVLTQAFLKHYTLRLYQNQCEKVGITVPIIPGIFTFEHFKEFEVFAKICRIKISNEMMAYNKDSTVPGTGFVEKLVVDIKNSESGVKHVHLFTMNKLNNANKFIKPIIWKRDLASENESQVQDSVSTDHLPEDPIL